MKTLKIHFIFKKIIFNFIFSWNFVNKRNIAKRFESASIYIGRVSTIQSHTFEQRIWEKPKYSLRITWVHVAPFHWLNKFFVSNFAYHIFGLIFYKSLGTYCDSYWLIKLVVMHPRAPKENVDNAPLWLTITNFYYESLGILFSLAPMLTFLA